jgi:hypothetical protein
VRAGRTRLGKEEEGAGFSELFFGGGVEGRDYGLDVVGGGDGEVCVLWFFLLVMSGGRGGQAGTYNWWWKGTGSSHGERHCCGCVWCVVSAGTFWSRTCWGRRGGLE